MSNADEYCLGAAFERPAEKYPRVFGYQFFRDYPYALPGMVISALTLGAALTTILFVKEV
jgi:hypothetical protein